MLTTVKPTTNEINQTDLKNALMGYLDRPIMRGNEILALCPFHGEKKRSFSVNYESAVYICFACGAKGKIKSLDLNTELSGGGYSSLKRLDKKIKVTEHRPISDYNIKYNYYLPDNTLSFQKLRAEPNGEFKTKDFLYRHKLNGKWIYGMPDDPINIYNVNEIIKNNNDTIYIVEGEKDVETLKKNGLLATTHRLGGNSARWKENDIDLLQGKKVIFIFDCDKTGINYARNAIQDFTGYQNFELLWLGYTIEKKHGKDTTDYIQTNGINNFKKLKTMSVQAFGNSVGKAASAPPAVDQATIKNKVGGDIREVKEQISELKKQVEQTESDGGEQKTVEQIIKPITQISSENLKIEKYYFLYLNSVNVLEGLGQTGKSTILAWLCNKFINDYNDSILYIYGEGRLADYYYKFSQSDNLYLVRNSKFKNVKQLMTFISKNKITMLILDPIVSCALNWGYDIEDGNKIRLLTGIFEDFQEDNNLTVVFVRHLTKQGLGRGSIELESAARAVYRVIKLGELLRMKDNQGLLPASVIIDFGLNGINSITEKDTSNLLQVDAEGKELAMLMLSELFKDRNAIPSNEILQNGEELGLSKATVRRAWQQLGYKPRATGLGKNRWKVYKN